MLPPPTTRQRSWPAFLASAISPARRAAASGSMPNACSPISASPDSFRRMRLKRGRGMVVRSAEGAAGVGRTLVASRGGANGFGRWGLGTGDLGLVRAEHFSQSPVPSPQSPSALPAGRRGDLRGEIAFLLLDAFAELETDIV